MRIALILSILLILTGGCIWFVAYTGSKPHEATLMTVVPQSRDEVYSIVTNIWLFPLLFNQAAKVELLETYSNGTLKWVEYDIRNTAWIYMTTEKPGPSKMKLSILSNRMYDFGSWEIEVKGNSNTSYISIKERSRFKNWWYQLRGLVLGRDKGLQMKIDSLDRYFKADKE